MLINKRLAWKALNLALYFNFDNITSKIVHGDKDTFRLSWKVLDTPFYFIRKFVGLAGFDYIELVREDDRNKTANFCGHTMIQHDPFGEILFLHANLVKEYPILRVPIEKNHSPFKDYVNVWRIYRRYANSAPYFRPHMFQMSTYLCMTLLTDEKYLPPLFEDDFHYQVSANITAKYLSYMNGSVINSHIFSNISVVDRYWTKK